MPKGTFYSFAEMDFRDFEVPEGPCVCGNYLCHKNRATRQSWDDCNYPIYELNEVIKLIETHERSKPILISAGGRRTINGPCYDVHYVTPTGLCSRKSYKTIAPHSFVFKCAECNRLGQAEFRGRLPTALNAKRAKVLGVGIDKLITKTGVCKNCVRTLSMWNNALARAEAAKMAAVKLKRETYS
jgi:hypothetical protein